MSNSYLKSLFDSIQRGDWSKLKTEATRVWPFVLLFFVVMYLIYYVFSYYYELKRRYYCLSLKNIINGRWTKCFDDAPEYCKDINPDLNWGWCMDPDYYGAYPGDHNSPYNISCNRWITSPNKCPPIKCQGSYPVGIKVKEDQIQEYGWCADPEINRGLRGTYCGCSAEEQVQCKNWVWDESKCPLTCPIKAVPSPMPGATPSPVLGSIAGSIPSPTLSPTPSIPAPLKQIPQMIKQNCSLVCGLKDGKQIPCPPPDCNDSSKQCQCKKPQ